jgi:hypothetical protein
MTKELYSVRCIFKHKDLLGKFIYEERITVWETFSFEEAMMMAENEAKKYAGEINCVYTGLSQSFHLMTNEIKNGSEVFSLMRKSEKNTKDYLDSFFDTGNERQRNIN